MISETWAEMSRETLAEADRGALWRLGLETPPGDAPDARFGWKIQVSDLVPFGAVRFFRRKGIETVFFDAAVSALLSCAAPIARITQELDDLMAETQSAKEAREKAAFESLVDPDAGKLRTADIQAALRAIRDTYGIREDLSARPLS